MQRASIARAHPLQVFRLAVPRCPPIRHPSRRLTGTGYIRLEIKSAIVSPLNELSHAYAYSRSSSTRSGVRVLGSSARPVPLANARARAYTHACIRVCGRYACRCEEYVLVRVRLYGTACVHGHEDLGSKRSRGPSGSDPSTPARIRHTRTPMLRGRARRCLGGVPDLYPASLRLRPPPSRSPPFPPRSSPSSFLFLFLSLSFILSLSHAFVPFTPFFLFSSFSLFLRFLSYVLFLFLLLFFFFSAFSSSARIHVHPRN